MALLCSQSAFHRSPSALMNVNSQDPNLGAHAQVEKTSWWSPSESCLIKYRRGKLLRNNEEQAELLKLFSQSFLWGWGKWEACLVLIQSQACWKLLVTGSVTSASQH